MSIIDKVRALELPPESYVVIGSGLLDALGLRESHDVDLVVDGWLFKMLQLNEAYHVNTRDNGEVFLTNGNIEVWLSWKLDMPFDALKKTAIEVEGVTFASPEVIIQRKQERGLEKDMKDIELLHEYFKK